MSSAPPDAADKALEVIDDCLTAYKLCIRAAVHCGKEGSPLVSPDQVQMLHDCADINLMLANFLSRDSRFQRALAALCIEVSEACAEALGAAERGDAQLRVAYAACLRAAQSCAELIGEEAETFSDKHDEAVQESFPASDPPPPPTQL